MLELGHFQAYILPELLPVFMLIGYIVTDRLEFHKTILFLNENKAYAVALFGLPFGVIYGLTVTDTEWYSILVTYLVSLGFYDTFIKPNKKQ